MLRYIVKRVLLLIPTLIGISLLVLLLIDLTPGDPARMMLGASATEEQVDELREELGLNDGFFVRWWRFISGVFQGDFGTSLMTKRPVLDEMLFRFQYTLILVIFGTVFSVLLGIPIGIYAATHQRTWKDNAAIFLSLIAVSMPLSLIHIYKHNGGAGINTGLERDKVVFPETFKAAVVYGNACVGVGVTAVAGEML